LTLDTTINPFLEHLDNNCIPFHDFGYYVALCDDKTTIFVCSMERDGTPWRDERNPRHMDWIQVTAPEPEFLDRVNEVFSTSFEYRIFSGR